MNDSSSRHTVYILALVLAFLMCASALPWTDLTGGRIKDFSLLEDLFPRTQEHTLPPSGGGATRDPALAELEAELAQGLDPGLPAGGCPDSAQADTVAWIPPSTHAPRIDGRVVVENYTGAPMLARFKAALAQAQSRQVRVAVLGDSFIEGDIFAQDVRRLLRAQYGGEGVGYMCAYSAMPGFRSSVRQGGQGWEVRNMLNMGARDTIRTFTGEYAIAEPGAGASFRGSDHNPSWSVSKAVFIARDTASVTLTIDGRSEAFSLYPSAEPQTVSVAGHTSSLGISEVSPGLVCLGVYLDGTAGIAVDCISNRGSSGLNLRRLNAATSRAVDYDLIILEFGINALNEQETDYSAYSLGMRKSVERLKTIFPNADIILLGIADRGTKVNGTVKSLPVCNAMTDAQRRAAHSAAIHFFDLRAAQGGENAVVDWRARGLVNADYIHLNHKGGRVLAEEFVASLNLSLTQP